MKNFHDVKQLLKEAKRWVEDATGVPWRATSYRRDSINHKTGFALDIAPLSMVMARSGDYGSYAPVPFDPLLPNRRSFIYHLLMSLHEAPLGVGFFIETDHIHVQTMQNLAGAPILARWPGPKSHCFANAEEDNLLGREAPDGPIPSTEMASAFPDFTGIDAAGVIYQKDTLLGMIRKSLPSAA